MSKIKIECTELERSQFVNMMLDNNISCKGCVLFNKCEKAEWYKNCVDMWETEIDWVIR